VLEIKNVSKTYGGRNRVSVLNGVTLSIQWGDFCALTGASGSGKTTLMNLIGLLDRPTSGEIEINGRSTSKLTSNGTAELRNRMIGFVFQVFHLLPRYSALDNVALPLLYRGLSKEKCRALAATALHQVGLADRMAHRPDELSGGQRQRVAIARALVGNPSVLLADEPTGNLDSHASNEIMSLFLKLNAELGLTVMIVTHDPTIAARCQRRIVMRDGRVLNDDSATLRSVGTA
jgi:putative ABC transport system ATP-binding protein